MPDQTSSFLASRNKYRYYCYYTVPIRPILSTALLYYIITTILYYTAIPSRAVPIHTHTFTHTTLVAVSIRYPRVKSVGSPLSINHHPVCRGRQSSPQRLSHQSKLPSHPLLLCPNPLLRDLRCPCPCAALQTPPRRVRSTPTLHSSSSASPRHLGPRLTSSSSLARQTCAAFSN